MTIPIIPPVLSPFVLLDDEESLVRGNEDEDEERGEVDGADIKGDVIVIGAADDDVIEEDVE